MTDSTSRVVAANAPISARSKTAIVLFTLPPEVEGRRKRIASPVAGPAIFRELIVDIERACRALPAADLLIASPTPILPDRVSWLPQRGAGFAESLGHAVDDAFALGYEQVIAIGNDAPEISAEYLREAIRQLEATTRSAVIGPSRDGGFALLGLSCAIPGLFDAMTWGASDVATRFARILEETGFRLGVLRTLDDIDGAPDLQRYLSRASSRSTYRLRRHLAPTHRTNDPTPRLPPAQEAVAAHGDRAPPPV